MPHHSFPNGTSATLGRVPNNGSTNYQNARRRRAWKNKLLSPSPGAALGPVSDAVISESSYSQISLSTHECSSPGFLNPPDSARMIPDFTSTTPSMNTGLIPENASEGVARPEADMYIIIPLESSEYLVYLSRELKTVNASDNPGRTKFIDIGLTRTLREGARTTILMGCRIFLVQVVEIFPISNKFVAPEIRRLGAEYRATQTGEIDLSPENKSTCEVTIRSGGEVLPEKRLHTTKREDRCDEDKFSCSQSKAAVSQGCDIQGVSQPEYNAEASIIFQETLDNLEVSPQSHDTPGVDLEELKYFKDYYVLPFVNGPSPTGMMKPTEYLSSPLLTINNNNLNSNSPEFTFSPFDDEEEIKVYGEPWTPIRLRPNLPEESLAACTDNAKESPTFLGVSRSLHNAPSLKSSVGSLSKMPSSSSLKPPPTPLACPSMGKPLSPVSRLQLLRKDNHST